MIKLNRAALGQASGGLDECVAPGMGSLPHLDGLAVKSIARGFSSEAGCEPQG